MLNKQRKIVLLAALAMMVLLSWGSPAQAAGACSLADFRNPDGSLDVTSYLACVSGQTAPTGASTSGAGLPRSGSDSGQLIGLAMVLVVLGAAATWGSRKMRPTPALVKDDSA